MNNEQALIGALIFLALVIGSNLILFAIVRSAARGDMRWLGALFKDLSKPPGQRTEAMDELRRRVKKLSDEEKRAGRK